MGRRGKMKGICKMREDIRKCDTVRNMKYVYDKKTRKVGFKKKRKLRWIYVGDE